MYALLLSLSIIAAAIGVFTIGFGISVYQSSFGNSLIIAGTVAVVGGMVMFGLAVAVRQLRRMADAMGSRPAPAPRRQPVPETADAPPAPRQAPAQRIPYPPRPDAREARADARPAPAPPMEAPEPPPMEPLRMEPPRMEPPRPEPPRPEPPRPEPPRPEPPRPEPPRTERPRTERPRPNIFGVARAAGDTPMVEEPESVPLAPNRMPAAPIGRGGPPPMPEPAPEPRPASPADIMARLSNLAASPQRSSPLPRPEPQRAPAPPPIERPAEQRPRPNMFDALWPAEVRAGRQSQPETIARAPRSEARPESKPEPRMEPKLDVKSEPKLDMRPEPRPEPRQDSRQDTRSELRFEPPMPRERMEPAVNVAPREPMAPPPAEPRPIAILKSGVIDGMAYTLYTDGSIEAELPQGTMRFGSIDELRAHLEKTERQE